MSSPSPSKPDSSFFRPDRLLISAAAVLILLPLLLTSSPEYREVGLLAFGAIALLLAGKLPATREIIRNRPFLAVVLLLLLIHAFTFTGGVLHGETALRCASLAVSGLTGVLGVAVLASVLLQPKWRRTAGATALGLTVLLVTASLLGYLVFIAWQVELDTRTVHFDPRRLALIWPTRIFTMPLGQQFWNHTNDAAYLFAAAWAVLLDFLSRRPRFAPAGWVLSLLLAVAVFFTASRSGFLMIAAVLPFLLVFRPLSFSLKTLAMLALAFGLGFAGLEYKIQRISPPPPTGETPKPRDIPGTIHVTGIVNRGSAGRMEGYQKLWEELSGSRIAGRGFASNRLPIAHLMHEHSTYLATLRAGGIPSFLAHLAILAIAFYSAIILARRGCRWPLLFAVAVFTGLLFDRSTVIRLTGFDEFLTHWLAVWIPILRLALPAEDSGIHRNAEEQRSQRESRRFA